MFPGNSKVRNDQINTDQEVGREEEGHAGGVADRRHQRIGGTQVDTDDLTHGLIPHFQADRAEPLKQLGPWLF